MTRLSDALHGAADRAPVGDATVSVTAAQRKVRSQRVARGAGNAAAGVGALALVAAGVFAPGLAASNDPNPESAALAPVPGDGKMSGEADAAMTRLADWGYCGSYPLRDWGYGDGTFSIVPNWDGGEHEGGASATVPVTVTSSVDGTFTTSGPAAVILWDGMVVGIVKESKDIESLDVTNGQAIDGGVKVTFTSCFDDEPLPASKYELLVSQAFTDATEEVAPESEPDVEPSPAVTVVGEDAVVSIDPNTGESTDPVGDSLPPVYFDATYRAVGEPIPFSIAGDPVEDPFGEHIPEPWTPPAKPEDILTPDRARELFEASATNTPWDFAPGTSRYLLNSYSNDGRDGGNGSYFGCAWEGQNATFPKRSADLGLLDVSVNAPSRISVSYGWVVDGNPQVGVTVRNTSEYSLPGFYGQPTRNLYLLKDGKVVAEAWPTDIDRYGEVGILQSDADGDEKAAVDSAMVVPNEDYWGVLDAGGSLSGKYLWREVNGCWTESGPANVGPGTYTLLVAQTIYIENGGGYATTYGPVDDVDFDATTKGSGSDGDSASGGEAKPAIASIAAGEPAPGVNPDNEYQWAELQAWFSVGTVTIN